MQGVGDHLSSRRGMWSFGDLDYEHFEDHVSKSVPGYHAGHEYIAYLSDYFISADSWVYDIGCSTGSLMAKLSKYHENKDHINFVGVEPVAGFEDKYYQNISSNRGNDTHSFDFIKANIQEHEINECDLVISYYTMQFVRPRYRQEIINMIYSKLNWGGGFFFFEKVRGLDARFHEMINLAYLEYKTASGYTNDEIIAKMYSLKGVLEPYTTTENLNFLKRAGFQDMSLIYKNLCFEGILAIK